jgi:hypothetical protein
MRSFAWKRPVRLATWKKAKLQPRLRGRVLLGAASAGRPAPLGPGADTSVQLFHDHVLIASHPRASRRGQRLTMTDHLPQAKIAGLLATPASCVRRAADIGPATSELVGRL